MRILLCAGMTVLLLAAAPGAAVAAPEEGGSAAGFVDTFAASTNADPLYGLNVSLDRRQRGATASYTRVSGRPDTDQPPPSGFVQVNHPAHPDRMLFTGGTSAVMLGAPARPDGAGRYRVSTVIDPVVGDTERADWGSLVLSRSRISRGYAAGADVDLGLTVTSGGRLTLYSAGRRFWSAQVRCDDGYLISETVSTGADRTVALAVNGSRFVVSAPSWVSRWPSRPYLYLGAYLPDAGTATTVGAGRPGQGLSVSAVDTSVVDGPTTFVDTFDGAASGRAADYGLNDSRRQRQPTVTSSGYTRVSGYPDHDRPPDPSRSRVNDPAHPNRLSFHGGPSAVRLDKPATADLRGVYTIEAVVDPVSGHGHRHGRGWVSLALSAAATRNGYPARPGTDLGLVVRSTGHAQLYQNGAPTWDHEPRTRPDRDGSFRVTITVAADEARLVTVTVNGTTRTVRTAAAMPRTAYLSLGSYANDPSVVSTVDELRVTPLGGLGYYGHFGSAHPESPNDGVDHTYELVRFTNLNQYLAGPETGFLDRCRPRSCIVYAGWQQFDGATLRPDAIAQLEILKATIGSNIDKVAAIDLVDEPYGRGISVEDLTTAVRQVGAVFPGLMRILVLDGPTVTNRPMPVPTEVDWVGFDWYCVGRDRLLSTLGLLEAQLDRYQRTFLMPEAAVANECPGWDDQRIAAEQDVYLDIAAGRPRIAYLMSFGWWFSPRYGGNMDPLTTLPLTVAAQRRIGGSVIGLRCPPEDERAP